MAEGVSVSLRIDAPAEEVWALVADLPRMAEWSPENDGVEWTHGATGPALGARFKGTNSHGAKSWSTNGEVVACEPGRLFTFRITAVGTKVSEWSFHVEPMDAGCRVTETWIDQRGALTKVISRSVSGVGDRAAHNHATMEETLHRLKAAAE